MSEYQVYYVENCENPDISRKLLCFLFAYSDAFSLIYFRHNKYEKLSHNVTRIHKELAPYELDVCNVNEWPGMKTRNTNRHIYRMITYKIDSNAFTTLEEVGSFWNWDYPDYPMDISFYKNGRAWFYTSAHERDNGMFIKRGEQDSLITDMNSIGLKLTLKETANETQLFYNSYLENNVHISKGRREEMEKAKKIYFSNNGKIEELKKNGLYEEYLDYQVPVELEDEWNQQLQRQK